MLKVRGTGTHEGETNLRQKPPEESLPMLFSCMTPLRRLSFATSKLADHRPFEIVGTVCRSNYITSDEVRETLSEMYLPYFLPWEPTNFIFQPKNALFLSLPSLEPTKDVGAYMATANCCAAAVTSIRDSGHRRLSTH